MIYVLTSGSTLLEVKALAQEARANEPNVTSTLALKLKARWAQESYTEQQEFLQKAATAAYSSLNKLDQRAHYRCNIDLISWGDQNFNFSQGSSSSGLGYALGCFHAWWRLSLKKKSQFKYNVYSTGEVLSSGKINSVSLISEKINSICHHIKSKHKEVIPFYFCFPQKNVKDILDEDKQKLLNLGAILVPSSTVQEMLGILLGDNYNGAPLARWEPFKGLDSFEYQDNFHFFGRDKDIGRAFQHLVYNKGILILSGPKRSGKTSLIKSGFVSKLEREYGLLSWDICEPSNINLEDGILYYVVNNLHKAWNIPCDDINEIVLLLKSSTDKATTYFNEHTTDETQHNLICIDDFEQFLNENGEYSPSLIQDLNIIFEITVALPKLIFSIVTEQSYLPLVLDSKISSELNITNISSYLSYSQWQSIVIDQALFSGITFENNTKSKETLDTLIIQEAMKHPDSLSIVSFTLQQLYNMSDKNDLIELTYKDYHELGGLIGVITYKIESIFKEYKDSENIQPMFFDYFIGVNTNSEPILKNVDYDDIKRSNDNLKSLVDNLINRNFIETISSDKNSRIIRLTHESLLTEWPILKDWIKKLERYLLWRNEIDINFSTWKTNKKSYNNKSKDNPDFTHEFYQKNKAEYPLLGPEFKPNDKGFEKFFIRQSIQNNNFNILIKVLFTHGAYKIMINTDKIININPFIATKNLINNTSIILTGYSFKLNFNDEELNLYLKESLLNIIEKPIYRVIYITTIITLLNYFIL